MLWFDEKLYLAVVLKSILSILFHWQNGGYLPKSRPRSYIHLYMIIWRDASRSIPIRFVFVIFTIQWLIFLRVIWFFFNTQIPFICRNEQFAQFKKSVFNIYIWNGWVTKFFQHQCFHWFNQHVHTIFPIFTHCLIQNQIT